MPHSKYLSLILLLLITNIGLWAQTREKGPWWPHPLWGAGDQAGSSNWITSEKVLQALKVVEQGKIYEIGQVYEAGMPLIGQRTYSLRSPGSPTGGPMGKNNVIYNDEFLVTEIGQVGTQFDGPGHIGTRVDFEDGSSHDVYYNGFTGEDMYSPYGLKKLGIENIKPIITKGVLIDIPAMKEVDCLDSGYEVTLEDVRQALEKQGMKEQDIQQGDAIFFRYGWSKYWSEPEKYNQPAPGIGLEVAEWVVTKQVAMVGSDQSGLEVSRPNSELAIPVHHLLITQNGIWNLENLDFSELAQDQAYQFLFIFTPVRFKGATGSPGRPIAIK
jgi:kynurenine formamidase